MYGGMPFFFFMSLEAFIPLSGMGPWQEPLKPWWLLTTVILWSPLGLKWYSLWHPSSPRWLSSHSFALFLAAAIPVLFPGLCVYQREDSGMHTLTFQCLSQGIHSCHHTARGQGPEGHGQNHWLISIVINNLCLISSCLKLSLPHQKRCLALDPAVSCLVSISNAGL